MKTFHESRAVSRLRFGVFAAVSGLKGGQRKRGGWEGGVSSCTLDGLVKSRVLAPLLLRAIDKYTLE